MRLPSALQNTTLMAMSRAREPKRRSSENRSGQAFRGRHLQPHTFFSDLIHLDDDIRVLLP
jgi:hypothetical protein